MSLVLVAVIVVQVLLPHVHDPSISVQLFHFLFGFQGKREQLVSGSSLLLLGFVICPCCHLGIVVFLFGFSFGGSNSCSDSCEVGKFTKKKGFGGRM